MKRTVTLKIEYIAILLLLSFLSSACKKETEKDDDYSIIATDIDGNVYNTITVNGKVWMVENLKTIRYRNGDSIVHITDPSEFYNFFEGAYYNYNNESSVAETYGRLYNFFAIYDDRNIAPEGWHVATDEEWQLLVDFLGGLDVAGGKLKEKGLAHWESPNAGATNEVGFTALPGGYAFGGGSGSVESLGYFGYHWTSTNFAGQFERAWIWIIKSHFPSVMKSDFRIDMAASIRCVKD